MKLIETADAFKSACLHAEAENNRELAGLAEQRSLEALEALQPYFLGFN